MPLMSRAADRRLVAAGAEGAAWAVASESTREMGERLLVSVETREMAERLMRSYANLGDGQRAGHMFELMHTHSFNANAIAAASPLRATMTSMAGSPTAPADILIGRGPGDVAAAVQAKLYGDTAETAKSLAQEKYAGMERLVASDKVGPVEDILDKRLAMNPDGIYYDGYADARAHLGAQVSVDGVQSDPVSRLEAWTAGRDPVAWAQEQLQAASLDEVLQDLLKGAAVGAVLGGAAALLVAGVRETSRARAGEVSAARAVATAVGSASGGVARGAAVAGLGAGIASAARVDLLPEVLSAGALPYALARSAIAVGEAGYAFARGEIDSMEFAARSGEVLLSSTLVYSFSAVGQMICPIPVLGAVVGGVAGQVCAVTLVKGVRLAIAAARVAGLEEEQVWRLEAEVLLALEVEAAMRAAVEALAAEFGQVMQETVNPTLQALEASLADECHNDALVGLATLTRQFGGAPPFSSVVEFESWMAEEVPFRLSPNMRR